ncbi:hypothetical protein V8E53_006435 [Lactarius tabidus]
MLDLKRGPQDPILPIRAAKHPRTTALYADSPTASQNEGLLSQWISSLVNLTTRATSGVFTEALRAPPPQASSSYVRRTEVPRPKSISTQPISLRSPHLRRRRSPKMRLKGTSPRSGSPNLPDSPPLHSAVTSGPHVTPSITKPTANFHPTASAAQSNECRRTTVFYSSFHDRIYFQYCIFFPFGNISRGGGRRNRCSREEARWSSS